LKCLLSKFSERAAPSEVSATDFAFPLGLLLYPFSNKRSIVSQPNPFHARYPYPFFVVTRYKSASVISSIFLCRNPWLSTSHYKFLIVILRRTLHLFLIYNLRSQIPAIALKSRSLCRRVALFSMAIWATRRSTVFLTVAPFFLHFRYNSAAAM
jgi:hypothetical protein